MSEVRLSGGLVVITTGELDQSGIKYPVGVGVSDDCCCGAPPPCPLCDEVDLVDEVNATLTVYDGTAPFGGGCGGVGGVYDMVLTLNVNGPGWYGFVDLDEDGAFTPGLDFEVRVTVEVCNMAILTNIANSLLENANWPPSEYPGYGYGFGECGVRPGGVIVETFFGPASALSSSGSPYCRPPAGTYDYFYYLLQPLPGTPPCDARFCAWTLVIE